MGRLKKDVKRARDAYQNIKNLRVENYTPITAHTFELFKYLKQEEYDQLVELRRKRDDPVKAKQNEFWKDARKRMQERTKSDDGIDLKFYEAVSNPPQFKSSDWVQVGRGVKFRLDKDEKHMQVYIRVNGFLLSAEDYNYSDIIPHDPNFWIKMCVDFHEIWENHGISWNLSDFTLRRIDLCMNVHTEPEFDNEEFIELQQDMACPTYYNCADFEMKEGIDTDMIYKIECSSKSFVIYDKTKEQWKRFGTETKYPDMLRIELQLDATAIRKELKGFPIRKNAWSDLQSLFYLSPWILQDWIKKFPQGDHYKYELAKALIEDKAWLEQGVAERMDAILEASDMSVKARGDLEKQFRGEDDALYGSWCYQDACKKLQELDILPVAVSSYSCTEVIPGLRHLVEKACWDYIQSPIYNSALVGLPIVYSLSELKEWVVAHIMTEEEARAKYYEKYA